MDRNVADRGLFAFHVSWLSTLPAFLSALLWAPLPEIIKGMCWVQVTHSDAWQVGDPKQPGGCHFQGLCLFAHGCSMVLERTGQWRKAAGATTDHVCPGDPYSGLPPLAAPYPIRHT